MSPVSGSDDVGAGEIDRGNQGSNLVAIEENNGSPTDQTDGSEDDALVEEEENVGVAKPVDTTENIVEETPESNEEVATIAKTKENKSKESKCRGAACQFFFCLFIIVKVVAENI